MHGFFTAYTTGPDSLFFLSTKDISREGKADALGQSLAALVNRPKFRLGVSLRYSHEGVVVESVAFDSPAARTGLQVDDKVHSINGEDLGADADPDAVKRHTNGGKPVEPMIQRGDERIPVKVTPVRG